MEWIEATVIMIIKYRIFINGLFKQDKYPEQLYRTCDGILNLSKKPTFKKGFLVASGCSSFCPNDGGGYYMGVPIIN